ncbi:MAG: N-acetylmuramoyl-L-alanine amidase [Bacteroidales bacterium]|nr:N-acetylmuramoyl-L-alanine amidase [Bacteroidales bacterium]
MRTTIKILVGLVVLISIGVGDFYRRLVDYRNVFSTDTRFLSQTENLSIVIHHPAADSAQVEAIERWHRDSCGWECGFAYPFFVTDSTIYQVHQDTARTIHAGNRYFNDNSIAVCLSGNFDKRKPTIGEIRNLYYTIAYLMIKYRIPPSRVYYHGEVCNTPTACCGKYLKPYINFINRRESNE